MAQCFSSGLQKPVKGQALLDGPLNCRKRDRVLYHCFKLLYGPEAQRKPSSGQESLCDLDDPRARWLPARPDQPTDSRQAVDADARRG